MLTRLNKLLSTQDKTTITTSTASSKQSTGLQKFVTSIVAGAIIFNSMASFGAVIAGDYIAKQEDSSYSQIQNDTKAKIENVINDYKLNTEAVINDINLKTAPAINETNPNIEYGMEGAEPNTTNISINAVNISQSQNKIHQLMSGIQISSGSLKGSRAGYYKGYHSLTIDMHELKNYFDGEAPDFIILHELVHSLIGYVSNLKTYNDMRTSALHGLDFEDAESFLNVYSESHADVYAILKIAQAKGTGTALKVAHKVYEQRESWGAFGQDSKDVDSHDTSHALNKVTDFLIEHPNLENLSNNDIYKISVEMGVESMNHWADKHHITVPETTKVELKNFSNESLDAITTQGVKLRFMSVSSADEYMYLLTTSLIKKLANDSNEMTYSNNWKSEGDNMLAPTPQVPTMYQLPTFPTI